MWHEPRKVTACFQISGTRAADASISKEETWTLTWKLNCNCSETWVSRSRRGALYSGGHVWAYI